MSTQSQPDDLASLRAELLAQRALIDALRADTGRAHRRRQRPRRALPLVLALLLVALVPFATLAAGPFVDLNGGAEHAAANADIQAIADAGITRGCDPPDFVRYCPNDLVTREQMASFLARAAGLGTNPPVANAKTAQTATNAAALGGQPPSAFLPASGDLTVRYPGVLALPDGSPPQRLAHNGYGGANVTLTQGTSVSLVLPLARPTGEWGRALAIKALRVCYRADDANIGITRTTLYANERGFADEVTLLQDTTARAVATPTCYDLPLATPRAVAGQTYLIIGISNSGGASRSVQLYSTALILTPLAAGATDAP
jgi:hypothetical protein